MKRAGVGVAIAAAAGLTGCRFGGLDELFGSLPTASTTASNLGALHEVTGNACNTAYEPSTMGHVVYTSASFGRIFRVEARPGAPAEDLSAELDHLSAGQDGFVNESADGQQLLISTTRFGCGDTACLAIVSPNVCSAQVIIDGTGNPISPSNTSAIGALANGDLVVVYPVSNAVHNLDLYAVHKHGGSWDTPIIATKDSTQPYNDVPTISPDGTKVMFDCGTNSYSGGAGTSLCEVKTDGTGFRILHGETEGPPGTGNWPLHKGNYTADGTIVFEGEWPNGNELIWEYPAGSATPRLVNDEHDESNHYKYSDDNTPCVMPDGRIVSLWLGRAGNPLGNHEIKIMNADGTGGGMLVVGENTADIIHGCGK